MNKKLITIIFLMIASVLGLGAGGLGMIYLSLPNTESVEGELNAENNKVIISNLAGVSTPASGEVSVHFLELGNKFTGDCTYIKVGEDIDILIDCGSKSSSIPYVESYLRNYVKDNTLDYVIVTHAHTDHYAGFATSSSKDGIFDLFYCDTIIYFSQTETGKREKSTYKKFENKLNDARKNEAGDYSTKLTALDCVKEINGGQKVFNLDPDNNVKLEILDSDYYHQADSTNENNNSVCCLIRHGDDREFLFTGDLEGDGEEALVSRNPNLPKVEIYKAGHHGSGTSSSISLLDKVMDKNNPCHVAVCCCAGSSEYSTNIDKQFPTVQFINNISQYTTLVYITTMCLDYKNNKFKSFNGNIVFTSAETLNVNCSDNNTVLKDTDWFKQNRLSICGAGLNSSWK